MVTEIVEIDVIAGREAEFEAAVAEGTPLFRDAQGCSSVRLERSIEKPSRYWLLVDWQTVDDHMVHFKNSPSMPLWRDLINPFFDGTPRLAHMRTAFRGF